MKKKLPHGSILHYLYDARQRGQRDVALYEIEVQIGISGWDLRSAVEDLKDSGFLTEHIDGVSISEAGYNEARGKWA